MRIELIGKVNDIDESEHYDELVLAIEKLGYFLNLHQNKECYIYRKIPDEVQNARA